MMNELYWEKFERTGNISDYLNYTACTAENHENISYKQQQHYEEVVKDGDSTIRHWNGINSDAHW